MALNDDLAVLRETPLFSDMPDDALRLLAFGCEHRTLYQGDTLYRQGDAASCAYAIVSGSVEVWFHSETKEPVSRGVLDHGGLLGELALISPIKRQFTVKAVENAQFLRINRDLFHRLLAEYPQLADILRKRIEASLSDMVSGLNKLGQKFR